ncbi:hypothetical protein LCGC14_0679920 [marine sediment metagenome]|uniref:Lipopolysaccharide heptosyltransferase II n=1 Tax=marine sediment metagenome TaxID=412755 RepID=A0A0F9QTP0_9ZZZZ
MISQYYNLRRRIALWRTSQKPSLVYPLSPGKVKALFVMTGLMGDTIMSIPAVIAFRENYPDAKITVLATSKSQELLSMVPAIDDFMVCDHSPFPLNPSKVFMAKELEREIKSRKFDVAIVLLGDDFVPMLTRAEIPIRVGVKENIFSRLLSHAYAIGSPETWGPEERLGAIRCLEIETKDASHYLKNEPLALPYLGEKLRGAGVETTESFVVLHPFGRKKHQWMPPGMAVALVYQIQQKLGMKPLIVSDSMEQASGLLGLIQPNTPHLVGNLSVPELAAVMKRSRLVISTDSGPMHLAGALGVPTVGVFRAIRTEHANRYPSVKSIWSDGMGCNMCDWNRCQVNPCRQLKAIKVEDIINAAQDMD